MYTCEPVLGYLCGENVLLLMMSPFPAWMLGREHSGKLNIIYSTSITMECAAGCEVSTDDEVTIQTIQSNKAG